LPAGSRIPAEAGAGRGSQQAYNYFQFKMAA